ncbi:diguanylate cyclase [Clostridium sp. 'White wine YQ']|uniref:diguanylate cyclase n=1 Tax=Clostridium sp. 'White wine YQ' TaxID=3027474 RepID=UPI002365B17D|nr:diguanylate cyclase [Clostridium sp. 'White wine YQ']MDD7792915.1 diguanylate cyclase [Clostridium sp. 'White wine YQ']
MKLINSRYRIEKTISMGDEINSYLVKDLEDLKVYVLKVIETKVLNERIKEHILSNITWIKNLNFPGLVNVHEFLTIENIDGIVLENRKYAYLIDPIYEDVIKSKILVKSTFDFKLNLFAKVLNIINTLSIKGYKYRNLSLDNVYYSEDEVKLTDILTMEIEKISVINKNREVDILGSSHEIQEYDFNHIEISNIYHGIFEDELENRSINSSKILVLYKNIRDKMFISLNECIDYINIHFEKEYSRFDYNSLNKIIEDVEVIGRDYEIKRFSQVVDNLVSKRNKFSIIGIDGDEGSGKTKLLNYFKTLIYNKFDYNANLIVADDIKRNSGGQIKQKDIFEYFLGFIDKNLIEKYGQYLEEFCRLLALPHDDNEISKSNRELQTINRVAKLLSEITRNKFTVLFVDNIESSSTIFKLLLKYLFLSESQFENLLIVITYNQNKLKKHEDIEELIYNCKLTERYEEYKISYLNEILSRQLIRNIMNTSSELYDFSNKIYKETLGNPMYIIAVVKKLFEDKLLFVSEQTGRWKLNLQQQEIALPRNIELEIERSLNQISTKEYEIMKKMSVINGAVEEDFLFKANVLDKNNYDEFYLLQNKGYISEKISDRAILYEINNNLVKKIVSKSIDEKEKKELHREISKLLEHEIELGHDYNDELIYQFDVLGETKKLIYFCKNRGRQKLESWDNTRAIYYYKKALEAEEISNEEYIEIALILADLYYRQGEIKESTNYYFNVIEKTDSQEDKSLCYSGLAIVGYRIDGIKETEYYLKNSRGILNNLDYKYGEGIYNLALLKHLCFIGKYSEAIEAGESALEICRSEDFDLKGYLNLYIGYCYLNISQGKEAIDCLNKAKNLFNKTFNLRGVISSNIYLGTTLFEIEENLEGALSFFINAQKASDKYQIKDLNLLSEINVAAALMSQRKFAESEDLLLKALEKANEWNHEFYKGIVLSYLSSCYLHLDKLQLAHRYLEASLLVTSKYNIGEVFKKSLKSNEARYLYKIKDYHMALDIMSSVIEESSGLTGQLLSKLRCQYHFYNLRSCKNLEDIISEINIILEEVELIRDEYFKVELTIDTILELNDLAYEDLGRELYKSLSNVCIDEKLILKLNYIKLLYEKNGKLSIVTELQRLLENVDDESLVGKVAIRIGETYEELNIPFNAIECYYMALSLIVNNINSLPNKSKLNYINYGRFLYAYNKFASSLENITGKQLLNKVEYIGSLEEFEDLLHVLEISNLIKNKEFLYELEENYDKCFYNFYKNMYDVFNVFKSDIVSNIDVLTKYLCKITLADGAIVTMQDADGVESIIHTNRAINPKRNVEFFKSRLNIDEGTKIIKKALDSENRFNEELLPKGMKAAICLRIKNRIRIKAAENTQGTLILYSNKYLNNINEKTLEKLEKLIPLFGFLLDKQYLTINSTIDKLTRVYNRKYFEETFADLLESSRLEHKEFSIAIFDVDNFKGVNDKFGHDLGDKVLRSVAATVKDSLEPDNILCRYGGEEFVIIFPNKNKDKALLECDRFREKVRESNILGGRRELTISIGVSNFPLDSTRADELIKRADEALYVAKNTGKNKTVLWDQEYGKVSQANDKLAGILSGNTSNDYRKVNAIMDVIEIIKNRGNLSEKIYELLSRINEIVESDEITFFLIKGDKVKERYSRKRYEDGWYDVSRFNEDLVEEVITNKNGRYLVDWDNVYNQNGSTWMPDWRSLLIVPLIKNGEVKGVVYLSVSINEKEFSYNDLNFVSSLVGIFSAML